MSREKLIRITRSSALILLPLGIWVKEYPTYQTLILFFCAIIATVGVFSDIGSFKRDKRRFVEGLAVESPIMDSISLLLGAVIWYLSGFFFGMILWIAFAVLLLVSHYFICRKHNVK